MAHNNSTPASVLNAPTLHPVVVYASPGLSRDERRHNVPVNFQRLAATKGHHNHPFTGKVFRDLVKGTKA